MPNTFKTDFHHGRTLAKRPLRTDEGWIDFSLK